MQEHMTHGKQLYMFREIEKKVVQFLVDTGSSVLLLNPDVSIWA